MPSPQALAPSQRRFAVGLGSAGLYALGDDWDALAARAPTPYLLRSWLTAWCEAFGVRELEVATLRDAGGALVAGAVLRSERGGLATPCNVHTGDWDAVAIDDEARAALWRQIAALGRRRLRLDWLRGDGRATAIAAEALAAGGYRPVLRSHTASPYLALPASWDDLLAGRSSNLRQQWRRRRRALERDGDLRLRLTTGGDRLESDLDALLALEASGWKGREGTAIVSDPRTLRLYRTFARGAAASGALRLYLLELDGRPLAADLGCVVGDTGFLVKTGFDEAHARSAPGLVLRGEVLRASIEEGLAGYDFLGGPDAYKVRWTDDVRPRVALTAYRGAPGVAVETYHRAVRPVLARAVRRARRLRSGSGA